MAALLVECERCQATAKATIDEARNDPGAVIVEVSYPSGWRGVVIPQVGTEPLVGVICPTCLALLRAWWNYPQADHEADAGPDPGHRDGSQIVALACCGHSLAVHGEGGCREPSCPCGYRVRRPDPTCATCLACGHVAAMHGDDGCLLGGSCSCDRLVR